MVHESHLRSMTFEDSLIRSMTFVFFKILFSYRVDMRGGEVLQENNELDLLN